MKKKLLGVIGSYRKIGNSEIVAKAIAARLGDGWELSLVRLPLLEVKPCKGCYACLMPGVTCTIDDDVEWLIGRMLEADALVFAMPDYLLGPIGMMKMLADRGLQFVSRAEALMKKPAVAALTLGKEDYRGYADTALISQVSALELQMRRCELFYGTHPAEIVLSDDFRGKIEILSRALTADTPPEQDKPDRCPRCGSDLFRLRGEHLECALCKSLARLEKGALEFFHFHPEFTPEGRTEHMNWLVMKKEEYGRIRERLNEIREDYKGGNWLTPGGSGR